MLSNTVWIYLTLFLFFSHLLNVSMVKETWGNYIYYFFAISGLYLPVLVYSFFRKSLMEKLPQWIHWGVWLYCFIIHTFVLILSVDTFFETLFPLDNYMHGNEDIGTFKVSFLYTISPAVLATEIGILFSGSLREWLNRKKWAQQFGLDELLLILIILFSIGFGFASNLGMIEKIDRSPDQTFLMSIGRFFYYSIQFFLRFIVYYGFYYVNKYYLIPQFLSKKGIVYYGFVMVLTILVAYPILSQFIQLLPFVKELSPENYTTIKPFVKDRGLIPGMIMILSVPIIVAMQWFEQSSQIANLEKEKSATELNLLKQQINPHFFFNTLNNLYALSIVKDKQTPEVILQLSELMRYVIYKGKEEKVAITEEIKYIEDYIQLQQIRLHKKLDFKFDKDIADEKLQVPPLLFITFVENAFKHGIEPAERDCRLHLSLHSTANSLIFSCENSIEEKNTAPSGIGLDNLRRRMKLRFPNTHKITLLEEQNNYSATIEIKDFLTPKIS